MWKNMGLTGKIIVAMVLGIILGLFINYSGLNTEGSFVSDYVTNGLFAIIGKLFVNSLKMLVVPLVLISLICGVCGIGDIRLLGRIGTKTFFIYMMTTALAIATAIGLGVLFGIGKGMDIETEAAFEAQSAPPLLDVFSNIIPSNSISAMANGDMLSIIFFAILIGISILMVGKPAKGLVQSLELINEVILKMVTIIMNLAPLWCVCATSKSHVRAWLRPYLVAAWLRRGIDWLACFPFLCDHDDCSEAGFRPLGANFFNKNAKYRFLRLVPQAQMRRFRLPCVPSPNAWGSITLSPRLPCHLAPPSIWMVRRSCREQRPFLLPISMALIWASPSI